LLAAGETLYATGAAAADLISWDAATGVAVVGAATADDQLVTPRVGAPRSDPRYIATLEPTALGPLVRPVYIGRTTVATEPRTSTPLYSLHALQYPISRGTPIFTLDGVFLGLVAESGTTTSVITGEFLRTMAESATRTPRPMPAALGLHVQDASATVLRAAGADRGVVVTHLEPRGAADGLVQPGDIIRAVDGVATTALAEFQDIESTRRPGERVTFDLVRRGKPEQVVVVARSRDQSQESAAGDLGLIGRTVPDAGIEVVTVPLHGAAARAGLRRGDLIVTVNGQPARDLLTLTNAYQALSPKTSALISVQRDDQHLVLALEKP
jgi:S1-C subfamily serine protease